MSGIFTVFLSAMMAVSLSACGTVQDKAPRPPVESTVISTEDTSTSQNDSVAGSSDEEQILAVYERMQQAMIDKDVDTLREIMGADTTVRHITGRTQTMDEWLADVSSGEMEYYSIDVTNPEIVINGDTAALTCSNVIEARIYGSHGTWTLSGGANFEKIDGKWAMAHPDETENEQEDN